MSKYKREVQQHDDLKYTVKVTREDDNGRKHISEKTYDPKKGLAPLGGHKVVKERTSTEQ